MLIPKHLHPTGEKTNAVAWTMRVGEEWLGRIGKSFSFGPSSLARAKQACEAVLEGAPFEKREGEKSWSGDSWSLTDW